MKNKFKILETVVHILDKDKQPMIIVGIIERPSCFTYLCNRHNDTETEYWEQELIKY